MRVFKTLVGFVLMSQLCGCDNSWPPRKDDMIEHFHKHRAGIEVLEAEFAKTDYLRMSIGLDGQAHADSQGEEYIESERLEGEVGNKWYQLFLNAGVNSIYDGDNYTSFEIYVKYGEDLGGITQFTHAPDEERVLKECKDEFSELGCGWCAVSLAKDWYVYSAWFDYHPDKEAYEAVMNDETSWDEYEKLQDIASDACDAKGREVIGYPPPDTQSQPAELVE